MGEIHVSIGEAETYLVCAGDLNDHCTSFSYGQPSKTFVVDRLTE